MTPNRSVVAAIALRGEIVSERLRSRVKTARQKGELTFLITVDEAAETATQMDDLAALIRGHHAEGSG